MAKLIGLSGPQGAGKSTLLRGIVEDPKLQKSVVEDTFKVSRYVQGKLGWHTLDEVFTSPDTMMEFQMAIVNAKYDQEQHNKLRDDVETILTERTFADIAAYTTIWADELVAEKKWSAKEAAVFCEKLVRDCASYQEVYDGVIFLPYMDHMVFEADPHRAKEKHLKIFTKHIAAFLTGRHPAHVPVFTLTAESVPDRIEETKGWIFS